MPRPSLVILALFLAMVLSPLSAAGEAHARYTIGIVPQFEARHLRQIWRPVLEHVKAKTGIELVMRGAPNISDFEQEFRQGHFDFAYMNPYHLIMANNSQGYRPLVRDVARQLQGVLVVRADDPITSPAGLAGQRVALPAPNALGASLLLRAELSRRYGLTLDPVYVKTHSSVYLNVALAETRAGGGISKTLQQQPRRIRQRLRTLYRTALIPSHPVAVHPRVPTAVALGVKNALLDLATSRKGRKLLAKIPITEIGPASMDDYLPLTTMGLERFYVAH